MKYIFSILFSLIASLAFSLQVDSLTYILKTDTLFKSIHKTDSIITSFQSKADSFHIIFKKQVGRIDSIKNLLATKIDSLRNINLPTEKLLKQYDSLVQSVRQRVSGLTTEFERLKSKTVEELHRINLPSPMHESVQKLQGIVNGFSLPTGSVSLTSLNGTDWLGLSHFNGNTLRGKLNIQSNLAGVTESFNKVGGEVSEVGQYVQRAQQFSSGHMIDVKNIDKVLEGKVLQMEGVEKLTGQSALLDQAKSLDSAQMEEKINGMVKEQVVKAAKDHFEGKQEVLQQAMSNMSRLKNKYDDVQSMAELPKKLPNPLKGRPLAERLIPGIAFEIQKSNAVLIDLNPMLVYRISPRISVGAGWNYRLCFDKFKLLQEKQVYGPRASLELKWAKGINFQLLPEIMNTTIPSLMAQRKGVDPAYREWVVSLFAGIKKDFTVYKQIKGNTAILYNLFNPDHLSPYANRLSVRFGFDFPIKRKNQD